MPHLVKMDQDYGKKGLQIVGIHMQQATESVLQKVIKNKSISFPVATGYKGPVSVAFIPHVLVFDIESEVASPLIHPCVR